MNGLKRLIHEVHRRSLWQVLGIYLLGSWLALQVVDVLANNFGLPQWFPPLALALLVIGLPIVLAAAFVQEGTAARAAAEAEAEAEAGAPRATPAPGGRVLLTGRRGVLGVLVALALWGVVATGWLLFGGGRDGGPAEASIAVLPFVNRSGEEGSQFFTDGMHEDILTQLGKIGSLKVISRTSVMRYRETEKSVPEIAAELGVSTVLEGGVERAGERVRISVQLIEAESDRHLWAESYDEELTVENIFAIRSDVARQIAAALQATLAPEVRAGIERSPTRSLEAFDFYTRGRYLLEARAFERPALESALQLFQAAIVADPGYARAYVGLADSYLNLANIAVMPAAEALPQAESALERALQLDDELAEAHVSRGHLLERELRFEEALDELERAIELNPGSAAAHERAAIVLLSLERHDEAIRQARRAVELDPVSIAARASLATSLLFARDYESCLEESRRILELQPHDAMAYYYLGAVYGLLGRFTDGIAAMERAVELSQDGPIARVGLAYNYALAGERQLALEALEGVPVQGALAKEIALVYGVLGELDLAFDYLERAIAYDPAAVARLAVDPSADTLRADPRFADLMRRAGLE